MNNDEIIDHVLKYEGGFTNDPDDHGGPTNFGITAANYGRWLNQAAPATADQVKAMNVGLARQIYEKWYIQDPHFDEIGDDKLRLVVVDSGVLHGVKRAAIWLQLSLGFAHPDGRIGGDTLTALRNCQTPAKLPRAVLGHRFQSIAEIVKSDLTQMKFLSGWINRAVSLMDYL